MKQGLAIVLTVICLLSFTEAAAKKPKYFNLYNELVGSWNVAKTIVSISTGEVVENTVSMMFNFTKGDIPNELLLEEYDSATKEEKRKPYQTVISVKSNYTASVSRFEPGAEREITELLRVQFNEFLHEEVYYASGSILTTPNKKYEISYHTGEMVKLEIDNEDERTVFIAKKIIILPEKTFFQKYGSYIIIGLSLVVQLVMTNMNQNVPV